VLNAIAGRCRHLIFFLAGLLTVSCISLAPSDPSSLVGKLAPDFSLTIFGDQPAKLSELKGNVVVLDFWATWCPSCQVSLPHLDKMSRDEGLAAQGLRVVAIDCGEAKQTATDFLAKNKLSLQVVQDEDGSLQSSYRIHSLPVTIIVGRDGSIRNVFSASSNQAEIDFAIENALASAI
jgi:thiol-disulfide isomerase/thioredoxin